MAMKRRCRECHKEIEQGEDNKSLAAWSMRLCEYHYEMKFPEHNLNTDGVIDYDSDDYVEDDSPYGWLDQFHGSWR